MQPRQRNAKQIRENRVTSGRECIMRILSIFRFMRKGTGQLGEEHFVQFDCLEIGAFISQKFPKMIQL